MNQDAAEDLVKDVDKLKEDAAEEVVEEAAAHMKTELESHMSPVTLDIKSGTH